jgi:hypothetical protein
MITNLMKVLRQNIHHRSASCTPLFTGGPLHMLLCTRLNQWRHMCETASQERRHLLLQSTPPRPAQPHKEPTSVAPSHAATPAVAHPPIAAHATRRRP